MNYELLLVPGGRLKRLFTAVSLLILFLVFVGGASAATYTWVGASTDWNDTNNWDDGGGAPSGPPNTTDTVIFITPATINTNVITDIATLEVSANVSLTLSAATTITNLTNTTASGSLSTSSNVLIIHNISTTASNTLSVITSSQNLTVDTAISLADSLTLDSGAGDLTVSATADGGSDLLLNSTGLTTIAGALGGTIALNSVTTNAGGTTRLGANISTDTGAQTYNDPVELTAAATLTGTTGSDVDFNDTLNGGFNLVLDVAGTTTFDLAVGGTIPIGTGTGAAITVNSGGTTEFVGTVDTASGLTQANGAGAITFRDNVTVAAGDTATTFNADVVLDGLTFDAEGNVTFGNAAGDSLATSAAPVTVDTVSSNTFVTVNSAMTLGTDLTVSSGSGAITLNGGGNGGSNLTLNSTGLTTIAGALGGTIALNSVTTNAGGTTRIGANISTDTGTQTYNDPVELTAAATLTGTTGSDVDFNNTLNGGFNLVLDVAGTTTFDLAVGGTIPIGTGTGAAITVNSGGTTEFVGTVDTASGMIQADAAGTITFRENLTLGAGDTASTFNADVVLDGLTVSASDALTFGNAGTDTLTLSTADVALGTLGAGSTLTVNSTVNGGVDLILTTADAASFTAAVGNLIPIGDGTGAAIIVNSGGTTEFVGTVDTASGLTQANGAGAITFRDNVTVAAGDTATTFNADVVLDGLTFDAEGNVTFGNAAGDSLATSAAPVTVDTVSSNTFVTVNSAMTLGTDLTVSSGSGAITLNGGGNGGSNLTLNSTGLTTIAGALGGTIALNSVTTNAGGTTRLGANISTDTGAQTYNDPVELTAAATLTGTTGSDVDFNDTLNGGFNLVLDVAGTTTFDLAVGGTIPIGTGTGAAITVNSGGTTEFVGTVDTASGLTQANGAGAITFRDNVTVAAGDTATTFNADVVLDGLTFDAEGNVTFGNAAGDSLATSAAPVTVDTVSSNTFVTVNSAMTLGTDLTVSSGSGAITLNGGGDGGSNLTLNSTGLTTIAGALGGTIALNSVTTNAGGTTRIGANISTDTGAQTYNDPVELTAAATLTGTTGSDVDFNNTLNGGFNLVLDVAGTTTFDLAVGGTIPIGTGTGAAITVNSGGTTEFVGTVDTASGMIQADAAGTITFRENLTLGAGDTASTFNADVVLDGLTVSASDALTFGNAGTDTLTLSTADVALGTLGAGSTLTVNSTVNGGVDLILTTADAASFTAAVGNLIPIGDGTGAAIIVNSGGTTEFVGTVDTASGLTQANGAGAITFRDNVTVAAGDTATTFNADVVLDGLTFDAEGNVTFGNAAGDSLATSAAPVTVDTVSSNTFVTVNSAMTLGTDLTVSSGSGAITLNGGGNGGSNLTLNSTGLTTIAGALGGTIALNSVTTNAGGTTRIGANISTDTGTQTYNDPVELTAAATLTGTTGSDVDFNNTLNGGFNLVLDVAGTTTFDLAVGGTIPIGTGTGAAITVNSGGTTEFVGTVDTASGLTQANGAGAITFRDNVTVAAGDTATTFNADVVLDGLTFDAEGNVTFGNAAGDSLATSAAPVTVDTVSSNTFVTVNSAMTLGTDLTVSSGSGAITLNGGGDGGSNLTLNSTGLTTIAGALGGTIALNSVTTNAGGTTRIGANISTDTGAQTYNDPVELTAAATLTGTTGSDVDFNNTLNGGFNLVLDVAGTTTFDLAVGGTIPIGTGTGAAITVNSGGTTEFVGTVDTASGMIQADAAGTITFRENLTLGAGDTASTFNADVVLDGLTVSASDALTFGNAGTDTLTLSTADVALGTLGAGSTLTVNSTVNGGVDLILTTADAASFTAAVGNLIPIGDGTGAAIIVNSGGTTEFVGTAIIVNSGGTTEFVGTVDTASGLTQANGAGAITFRDNVTVAAGDTATTFNADVVLDGLTFDAEGNVTFGNAAGDSLATSAAPVTVDTVSSNTFVTVNSAMTLGTDLTVSSGSGAITLNGGGNGGSNLTLNSTGLTTIAGALGGTIALNSVTTNAGGTTRIGANISTDTGTQTYNDPVELTAAATLTGTTGSDVDFNNTLNGGFNLVLDVAGTTTFDLAVGGTIPIGTGTGAAITVNSGGTTEFVGTVDTASGLTQANGAGAITFRDNVTVAAGDTATTFNADVVLDGLTFDAEGNVTFGNAAGDSLATSAAPVTVDTVSSNTFVTVNSAMTLGTDLTVSSGSGAITLNGGGDGGSNLTLNSTGLTTIAGALGGTIALNSVTTNAGGTTRIGANISTDTGAQTYNDPVELTAAATLTGTTGSDVDFNNTLNGGFNLVLDVAGTTTFDLAVGGTIPIGTGTGAAITVNSGGTTEFVGTVDTASGMIQADAAGTITFRENLTLGAGDTASTFNADVVLDGLTVSASDALTFGNAGTDTLTLSTADVALGTLGAGSTLTVNSTVNGGVDLILTTADAASFTAAVGNLIPIGDGTGAAIIVNSGGTTEFVGTVDTASGLTQANGAGAITFRDNVTVAAGDTATTFNADVVLDGLTFDAEGNVTFGNAAGDSLTTSAAPVTVDTVSSNTFVTVNSAMTLGTDLTVSSGSGAITLNGGGDGGSNLTLNSTGLTTIAGALGGTIALNSVTTNAGGTTRIGANISTDTGAQTYNDPVELTAAATLTGTTGSDVDFNNTLNGGFNLVLDVAGTTTFDLAVGGTIPIGTGTGAAITVNSGGTTEFVGTVDTASGLTQANGAGAITFRDNVTVAAGDTATTFNADVVLDGLTFDAEGNVTFGNAAGDSLATSAAPVTVDTVSSNTFVTVNSAMTLGTDLTVSSGSGAITLNGGGNGGSNLTLNSTGLTTIAGALGGTIALNSVTTNAGGTTRIGANISTDTGAQTYNDPVELTAAATLTGTTGSDVDFNNTLNGGFNLVLDVAGTTTFDLAVGGTIPIGTGTGAAITVNSGGTTEFVGTVDTASGMIQADAAGTITFRENITLGAGDTASTFNANVVLDGLTVSSSNDLTIGNAGTDALALSTAAVDIDTTGFDLTVNSEVFGGNQNLTLSSGAGDVVVNGVIGNLPANALQSLTATGTNIQLYSIGASGTVGINSNLNVTANNRIELDGQYYNSTGAQQYSSGPDVLAPPDYTEGGTRVLLSGDGEFRASSLTFGNALAAGANNIGDVYLDFPGWVLTLYTNITCSRFAFFNGTINFSGTRSLSTTNNLGGDFVVLGGGGAYTVDDSDWLGVDTRFEYPGQASLAYDPLSYNAIFGDLADVTINVGNTGVGDFYVNGTDLVSSTASPLLTLNLQDNSGADPVYNNGTLATNWGSPYNIALNMTVQNSVVTGGSIGAVESVTDNGNNSTYDYIVPAVGWDFTRPDILTVETVWDDAMLITFTEPIANINNEISSVIGANLLLTDAGVTDVDITETVMSITDDGTSGISTDGQGNLTSFIIRFGTTWKTDANNASAGAGASTDTTGDNTLTTIPNLSFIKTLFFDAGGKNPIQNYGNNGFPVFQSTSDSCPPVIIDVTTGNHGATGDDYDHHNYMLVRYSEPIIVTTDDGSTTRIATGDTFTNQIGDSFPLNGTDYLGEIPNTTGPGTTVAVTVTGVLDYTNPSYSGASVTGGFYSGSNGMAQTNTLERIDAYELQFNIVSYNDGSYWPGYLGQNGMDITQPEIWTGLVSNNVRDGSPQQNRAKITTGTVTQLGGGWDVDPPAVAIYKNNNAPVILEAIPLDESASSYYDRVEFHVLDDGSTVWNTDTDHPDGTKGIRDSSFLDTSAFGFDARDSLPPYDNSYNDSLPIATDITNKTYQPSGAGIDVADDPYFSITLSAAPWDTLTRMAVEYDEDIGFMTDLAGNRVRSFLNYAVEYVPPEISLTLAMPGSDTVYVEFSEAVYGDPNAATDVDAGDFFYTGGALTIDTVTNLNSPANTQFEFTLSGDLSRNDIFTGRINIVPLSVFDEEGNAFRDNFVRRVSDLGIDVVEPVWASDGIHAENINEGSTLKDFDGTGRLLDRDILIQSRVNASVVAGSSMRLYYDANVPSSLLQNDFWLPSYHPVLAPSGNFQARYVNANEVLNNGLQNFIISSSDKEMDAGNTIEFMFVIDDLPCVRLSNPNDIWSYEPYKIRIEDIRKQKGGVTILNNVINPNNGDKAVLMYDVPNPGVVTAQIFTLNGNLVRILQRGRQAAGTYQYVWDGRNNAGNIVARGIYFVRVVGPDTDEIRKIMVVK